MLKRKLQECNNIDINEDKENQNPVEIKNKKVKKDYNEEQENPQEVIVVESGSEEDEDDDESAEDESSEGESSENESSDDESSCVANKENKFSPEFNQKACKLNECLQKVKGCGDYSVEGRANELPIMMGLEIKDFGPICLPFIDPQASKLIEICEQAPFGRNEKTLVDKTVRDSYQLQPSSIRIKNPEWNVKLKELVARVAKGLGCLSEIEARLYKLLVYKSGGHFLKHRDTEKEEGMFGTLVIQLPSKYEGGELVVYESGNKSKRVIDFGQKEGFNEFAINFAAHYADLEHELLEVKSGYRLVLVYSLCWLNGNRSYVYTGPLKQKAQTCLEVMNNDSYVMAIMLDHKYTKSALSHSGVNALKGIDHDRYNLLKVASDNISGNDKTKQLEFFICQAKMEVPGDNEDFGMEDEETSVEIKKWYDCNGAEIFSDIKEDMDIFDFVFNPTTSKKMSINYLNSEYWEYERELEGEYTGNEEMNPTTVYSKCMLVAFCKFNAKDLKFNSLLRNNLGDAIKKLLNQVMNDKIDNEFLKKLHLILKKLKVNHYSNEHTKVIQILDKIGDLTLILEFIGVISNMPSSSISNFNSCIVNWLIKYDFQNIMPSLSKIVKPVSDNLRNNCQIAKTLLNKQKIQLALKFLNEQILPILNDKNEFKKVVAQNIQNVQKIWYQYQNSAPSSSNLWYDLVKTILLFENQEKSMQKFKDRVIEFVKAENIGPIISTFMKEPAVFKSSPAIRALCEYRQKWLENKISQKPEFSWHMPNALLPQYPQVESFLRSEKTTINLVGIFTGIPDARRFANSFNNRVQNGFSINSVPNGVGRSAYVTITKTRDFYEQKISSYRQFEQEMHDLKKFLN